MQPRDCQITLAQTSQERSRPGPVNLAVRLLRDRGSFWDDLRARELGWKDLMSLVAFNVALRA